MDSEQKVEQQGAFQKEPGLVKRQMHRGPSEGQSMVKTFMQRRTKNEVTEPGQLGAVKAGQGQSQERKPRTGVQVF